MCSQICQCETRWAGKRCAQAPSIIFNFPQGAGGTFLCPPSSCSAEGAPRQPPVPTHTHTQSPPSSRDALSLRRDAAEEKDKQSTPALRDTHGPCPRQGASSALPPCGGAAPHPLPALPAVRGTVPQRQESNPAPPPRVWRGSAQHSTARLGTARLCSPSPLSARRSLLREAGGAAAVRDAEGLRAPSEAGTGSSPGAQPPRLLKTETLRLRRSLCFPFLSPARLASLHVLSGRGASARPHGRLQRRQGQNGVEERR